MDGDAREAALQEKLAAADDELATIQEQAWGTASEGTTPDYTALALCSLGRLFLTVLREDLIQ